jgi:signal peptidase I
MLLRSKARPAHASRWIGIAGMATVLLLAQAHFRLAMVSGDSMRPELRTGDLLLVDKRAFRARNPARGEVVLAQCSEELIVKRVIGLPGEEIALHRGRVYVNGTPLVERYGIQLGPLDISSGVLFREKYALLGDNRNIDVSQVAHVVVSREQIVGKIVWSLGRLRARLALILP